MAEWRWRPARNCPIAAFEIPPGSPTCKSIPSPLAQLGVGGVPGGVMPMSYATTLTAPSTEGAAIDLRRVGAHPDHWYPLAWSREVRRGRTMAAHFAGQPIVLARAESGDVFALEDRCAHRQVPLHAGVVSGEQLKCCYHGWTYDRSGRCISVPYIGADRHPNGVRAYPVRELAGLVFVFPGDA